MKKIIIVHHEPLTLKIKRNFFIEELREKGCVIEYWDIHFLLLGELALVDEIDESYSYRIDSYKILEEKISANKDSLFILEFLFSFRAFKIFRYFTKYGCLLSAFGIHTSINLKMKEKLSHITDYGFYKILPFLYSLMGRIGISFFKILFPVKKIDVFFYCGEASYQQFQNIPIKLGINSFDYEDYVVVKEMALPEYLQDRKYAVFLDEYLPYHPDIKLWGRQNITPKKYYTALNDFFDKIEKKYSLEVIIAAHPKSNYDKSQFNGRSIYKYKTAELVKYSQMVFAHDSLSISFAVLNYKPLIFIYTSEFYRLGTTTMLLMKKFSCMLNRPLLKLDEEYILNDWEEVEKNKYDYYKYNYLTNKSSENDLNVEIIHRFVEKL